MTNVERAPRNVMPLIGGVILFSVAAYYAFLGADTLGLPELKTTAVVVGKGYRAAGTTYVTRIIENRPYVLSQATPEAYLLELKMDGQSVDAAVSRELFETIKTSDGVRVAYRKGRLTGTVRILGVERQ